MSYKEDVQEVIERFAERHGREDNRDVQVFKISKKDPSYAFLFQEIQFHGPQKFNGYDKQGHAFIVEAKKTGFLLTITVSKYDAKSIVETMLKVKYIDVGSPHAYSTTIHSGDPDYDIIRKGWDKLGEIVPIDDFTVRIKDKGTSYYIEYNPKEVQTVIGELSGEEAEKLVSTASQVSSGSTVFTMHSKIATPDKTALQVFGEQGSGKSIIPDMDSNAVEAYKENPGCTTTFDDGTATGFVPERRKVEVTDPALKGKAIDTLVRSKIFKLEPEDIDMLLENFIVLKVLDRASIPDESWDTVMNEIKRTMPWCVKGYAAELRRQRRD